MKDSESGKKVKATEFCDTWRNCGKDKIAQGKRYRKWSQKKGGEASRVMMVKTGKIFSSQILQNGQRKIEDWA